MSNIRRLAFSLLLLGAGPAEAAPPPPAAAAQPDPLADAYEALPEADRRAIQAALVWTGDFNGAVAGRYGPRTRDALLAYARRANLPASTVLDPPRRARLLAAADAARRAVGFAVLRDSRAGLTLGVPIKLMPNRTPLPDGTRYAAGDGAIVLDVVGRVAGADALADMFARLSRDAPGRRVTYKLNHPDLVVVTGEAGDRKFYSRYAVTADAPGGPALRGFTLSYPAASADMDRITLAVAAAFDPPAPAAPPTTASSSPPSPPPPSRRLSGEAVLVGPGLALTRIAREQCRDAEVGGSPASWSRQDDASGLALLSVPGHRDAKPIAMAPGGGPADAVRYALFLPADGPAPILAVARAEGDAAGRVRLPLQGADAGVVVVDGAGALAGLAGPRGGRAVSVGGVVTAADYDLAAAPRVADFLAAAAVPVASPGGGATTTVAAAASSWRPLILPLRCGAGAPTP